MTMKEKAKELRKELKDRLGLNSRKVSVSVRDYTVIDVKIKSVEAVKKMEEVKKIAKKYERIDRDEITGEILSGGNDYVFIDVDWGLEDEITEKILKKLPYKSVKEFKEDFEMDGIKINKFDGESIGIELDGVEDYVPMIKYYDVLGRTFMYMLIKHAPEKLELFL